MGSIVYAKENGTVTEKAQKSGIETNKHSKEKESTTVTMEDNQLKVSLTYGYENTVKIGRYMEIKADITNTGDDFSGVMQGIFPFNNADGVMYQRDVMIPKQGTKTISMNVPISGDLKKFNVRILDETSKVKVKQKAKVTVETDGDEEMLFTGVLTDEHNSMGYLSRDNNRVFYLDESSFPKDAKGLNTLDILVINNFNTSKLTQEQYSALKDWVNQGGTLVLGTGTTYQKTLDIFKDDFITGTFGGVDRDGNAKVAITNGEDVQSIIGELQFQKVEKGSGCILIFPMDLGLDYKEWKKSGAVYAKTIIKYYAYQNKNIVNPLNVVQEDFGGRSELEVEDQNSMPSVSKYALILFCYIVIVGPVLYLVLKKADRRNLMWILVPLFSVICSLVVYLAGSETRITSPYIRYGTIRILDGSGSDKGIESTVFSITAPSNKEYHVAVPKDSHISALAGFESYEEGRKVDYDSYKSSIQYAGDRTFIGLKNYAAFSPAYFCEKKTREGNGGYTAEITNYEYQFSGSFTNELGYDLENAVFVCDNTIFIADDIKNGETFSLNELTKDKIYYAGNYDDLVVEQEMVRKVIGCELGDTKMTADKARRYYMLEDYFMQHYNNQNKENYILAFMNNKEEENSMKEEWGLDSKGVHLVVIPLQLNYKRGRTTFVPNINSSGNIIEGTLDDDAYGYFSEDMLVEYKFGEESKVLALQYSKIPNGEFNNLSVGFYGKVSAYNYKKKSYDVIFVSGEENEITDLKNYLDGNNKMLLRYQPDEDAPDGNNILPTISLLKEVQ